MDNFRLQIKTKQGERVLQCKAGENLWSVLNTYGYNIPAFCGGNHTCGKCKVQILSGASDANAAEKEVFTKEELDEGWRLACNVPVYNNMTINVLEETPFYISAETLLLSEYIGTEKEALENGWQVAIDIGTTTLAFCLCRRDLPERKTITMLNRQRSLGADVLSRIQAAKTGRQSDLRELVQNDLKQGLSLLTAQVGVTATEISEIVIGANTTMIHLLLGYDCSGLGEYPFTPVSTDMQQLSWNELMEENSACRAKVTILPGISAFVGGDIVAGMYACGFDKKEKVSMLIDLGTNGEIVIGNRERILVTSTAAGPAFEGGNISCGTGSIEGAVSHVTVENGEIRIRTIGEKTPVGICGSGAVELTAELLRVGYMDETGLLSEEYFETGISIGKTEEGKKLIFTQGDIREMQLAKAAIRAGIEVLIRRFGVDKEEISDVYIAGGFGYGLDIKKAIAIGMFPEEFTGRIQAVGNSCLSGAMKFLRDKNGENVVGNLCGRAKELNLAMDEEFQEIYMNEMLF